MSELNRVRPVDGARVAVFDWDAATDAMAMVERTMVTVLGDQVEARRTAGRHAADEWLGFFRGEFDRAETALLDRFDTTLSYGPMTKVFELWTASGLANDRQEEYNAARGVEIAEEEEAAREAAGAPGPTP